MPELVYEVYNKKSLAVHGDKQKYQNLIKKLGGRWNPRMKTGPGWTVPKEKESLLKNLIESLGESQPQTKNNKLDCPYQIRGRSDGENLGHLSHYLETAFYRTLPLVYLSDRIIGPLIPWNIPTNR